MINGKAGSPPQGSARTAEVPLTRGLVAIVDADAADRLVGMGQWYAKRCGGTTYAARAARRDDGRQTTVYMHQVVAGASYIDHINGDGLDNRRSNLRPASTAQNQRNKRTQANSASGYKGVHWDPTHDRWRAQICVDGRRIRLGRFSDPVEAAKAYDEAAVRYFGEFARPNFVAEDVAR